MTPGSYPEVIKNRLPDALSAPLGLRSATLTRCTCAHALRALEPPCFLPGLVLGTADLLTPSVAPPGAGYANGLGLLRWDAVLPSALTHQHPATHAVLGWPATPTRSPAPSRPRPPCSCTRGLLLGADRNPVASQAANAPSAANTRVVRTARQALSPVALARARCLPDSTCNRVVSSASRFGRRSRGRGGRGGTGLGPVAMRQVKGRTGLGHGSPSEVRRRGRVNATSDRPLTSALTRAVPDGPPMVLRILNVVLFEWDAPGLTGLIRFVAQVLGINHSNG